MHVYYKDQNLIEQPIEDEKKKREEKNLSQGEVTAINFVFIVSILEFAKRQKEKEDDEDSVLSLPLVLERHFQN